MPLIKKSSNKAFEANLEAEMDAGKPTDQALAIAYNVQRSAKKKGMYQGGVVADEPADELMAEAPKSIAEAIRLSRAPKVEEIEALEMDLAGEHVEDTKPFLTKAEKIRARIKELNGRK